MLTCVCVCVCGFTVMLKMIIKKNKKTVKALICAFFFFKWELRWNCIQLSDIVHTSMVFMTLAFVTGRWWPPSWAASSADWSEHLWEKIIVMDVGGDWYFPELPSTVYIYSLYMRFSVAVGRTQDALFKHLSLDFITSPQDYQNNLDTDLKSLAFFRLFCS